MINKFIKYYIYFYKMIIIINNFIKNIFIYIKHVLDHLSTSQVVDG